MTMYYRLRKDYLLRRNGNKILVLPRSVRSYETSRVVLHPVLAIIAVLLNNTGDIKHTIDAVSYVFDTDVQQSQEMVDVTISKLDWALEQANKPGDFIDPTPFVVNASEIDLDPSTFSYPATIAYLTTYECRARCVYCYAYHGSSKSLMPTQRFEALLDEGVQHGLDTVFLSGGDPFCHPGIFHLVAAVIKRGISCYTSTKIELLDKDVERLADTGLKRMQVSLDSHIPEIADYLTGVEGHVGMATRTIQRLTRSGFEVLTNSVVTAQNVDSIHETIDYLVSLGCTNIALSAYGRSLWTHSDMLFAPQESLVRLLDRVEEARARHPGVLISYSYSPEPSVDQGELRRKQWENRSRCTAGREAVIIHPDGKVGLCEMMPQDGDAIVGDLMSQTLLEIWQSPRLERVIYPSRDKFEGTVCYTCPYFDECHLGRGRCMRNSALAFGSIYAPDPYCPMAPAAPRLR